MEGPAFSLDPSTLRQRTGEIPADKYSETTILLDDLRFVFDEAGRATEINHLNDDIESQEGVENCSEISAEWQSWHQDKPEIKARVVTAEGAVHWLGPKTLNDVPLHQKVPQALAKQFPVLIFLRRCASLDWSTDRFF